MTRILVIEQEKEPREQLAGLLSSFGHDVLTASDGEEGLASTFRDAPDLVVADLLSGCAGGEDYLRRVRGQIPPADLPIILLAPSSAEDRVARAFEAGVTDVLVKPFELSDLHLKIQTALNHAIEPHLLQVRRGGERPPPMEPGALLDMGKYRIVSKLGAGGMGRVFHARHVGLGEDVAIKLHDPAGTDDPTAGPRFVREVKIALELKHPSIVRVLDANLTDNLLYYVMEKLPARSVRDAVGEGSPLEEARVVSMGVQIASALAFMHEKSFVHRDVKPENIVFVDGEHVKLIDFGLVFPVREGRMTQVGILVGTPGYIAPENLTAFRAPKPSGDIFSLGVTLYVAASGLDPYGGPGDSPASMAGPLLEEPSPLRTVNGNVSSDLSGIVQRMMTRDPQRRFGKMREVHSRLAYLQRR